MRVTSILAVALFAIPAPLEAKIAINRAIVVEVHAPGSAKGMKHGAVTLQLLKPYTKKAETLTTPLTANTQMTRLVKRDREKIELKDLKPGMIALIDIYGFRNVDKENYEPGWLLGALHVLGSTGDADDALIKIVGQINQGTYVRVKKVGPPLPDYKDDLGSVEIILNNMPAILRVTKQTRIVWVTADAKETPATLDDIRTINPDIDVGLFYPALLGFGDPLVCPARTIMLNVNAKKK